MVNREKPDMSITIMACVSLKASRIRVSISAFARILVSFLKQLASAARVCLFIRKLPRPACSLPHRLIALRSHYSAPPPFRSRRSTATATMLIDCLYLSRVLFRFLLLGQQIITTPSRSAVSPERGREHLRPSPPVSRESLPQSPRLQAAIICRAGALPSSQRWAARR